MKRLKKILQLNNLINIILFLIVFFSLSLTLLHESNTKYSIDDNEFKCRIYDKKFDGNKLSLKLNCKEKLVGTYYFKSLEEKEKLYNLIEFGDEAYIKGNLSIPNSNTVPYLFNYKKYLKNNQIYHVVKIDKIEITKKNFNILLKIKNYFYRRANQIDNIYIYAFILGDTTFLENDVIESFRDNGISHLLALSGLHVGIFSLILDFILKKLKIISNLRIYIIFIILIIFSFISGFSPSLLRASLFAFIIGLNKNFDLGLSTIDSLKITFIVILLTNPFNLFNVGFILSFITTFFLIFNIKEEKNYFKSLLRMSITSYFASLGVSIYYFGSTNLISPLLNLFFVPLVSFIIFPLCLLTFVFPLLNNLLELFIYIFENSSLLLNSLNFKMYFPYINLIYIYLYYIFLYLFFKLRKKYILIIILILLIYMKSYPYFNSSVYFYYLDVGQGDSIIIVTPHLKDVIMIDTGGKAEYNAQKWKKTNNEYSIANDTLIPFLRRIGVGKVDYLLLSHGDYDHMGEAINLVNNFKVEKVIFNCGPYNDLENELIKVLDKKKIKYYSCISKLDNLYFLNTKEYDNENDNSNVIYTELNGYKFMLMGDASTTTEKEILDKYNLPDIDVLKVGHHGSNTSSGKEFIDEINPKYSIISVGKNNRYGHPNKEVLYNLNNSKIYRTDQDGSIMFKMKNNKLKIETCSS